MIDLIKRLRLAAEAPVHHWEDWANRADSLMREAAALSLAAKREQAR